ncbi:MAG TPA: cystathionine gamma-synthase family protein [Steroidobacteraceae bacterium]|nr:cystathionine gamma-synthase family protein [Steroidobacteraceae bacterium]
MVDTYHKRKIGQRTLSPETQMMGYGYEPHLSEGALKPPVFLTSTFVFRTAQDGKDFFDYTSGRRPLPAGSAGGLVYSRFNNPNLEVLEDRLALWDEADAALVFSSGMSAIATAFLAHLKAGDVLLYCEPLYGGTETLIAKALPNYGIRHVAFDDGLSHAAASAAGKAAMAQGRVALIMTETPANPTNALVDLGLMATLADEIGRAQGHRPLVVTDNTLLGPLYQNPLKCGADLNVYSLTKYVGGHSDLVAGGVTGRRDAVQPIRLLRGALGTQLDPNSAWMLLRSLETLKLRMERANHNAQRVAEFLATQPKVRSVLHLGLLAAGDARRALFERQCRGAGSTFSFEVEGGEAGAFRFLDALQVIKLAVSLGGTESLASHPAAMTHSGVPAPLRQRLGISESMIRVSIGIEDPEDLIEDVRQALAKV